MSPINASPTKLDDTVPPLASTKSPRRTTTSTLSFVNKALTNLQQKIAPLWPLKDYVAVNPYAGFASHDFLSTREYLRTLSDLELFMPVDYYRQQLAENSLDRGDIAAAVDEMVSDGVTGAERIDVNQVVALLREKSDPSPTADSAFVTAPNPNRTLYTISEIIDRHDGTNWCRQIADEISKQCASHYDQGQAAWPSTTRSLPLFTAWRSAKQHDLTYEILGVGRFREFVTSLPHDGQAALTSLLIQLDLPTELWEDYLLCTALKLPGWSAWTTYQHRETEAGSLDSGEGDFVGLLAIRLAYEVALAQHLDFHVAWPTVAARHAANRQDTTYPTDKDLLRYALLKASEIAFRNRLLAKLSNQPEGYREQTKSYAGTPSELHLSSVQSRSLAQLVFCIDVRSERIRRHLEATSPVIETFGYAGFFGLPIEFVDLGAERGNAHVPVLIKPSFKAYEEIDAAESTANHAATYQRDNLRFLRKGWKNFQLSAVSMFAFVEATGLYYGWKLLARSIGWVHPSQERYDGVANSDQPKLAPTLRRLSEQGIDPVKQADLAESILRGTGIVTEFAKLVVFCGHGSEVENNPLKAGLDCGACGGHSGEPNARLAAKLLNQKHVRDALAERGIAIPDDTYFVAALHNTTTDNIEFFDKHELPRSHHGDLEELAQLTSAATEGTRQERLSTLPGPHAGDLNRRSKDWSEVRPEWGLAGNAAFIAAPREWTRPISLEGRSFLHSYTCPKDPGFAVLEQIMTAPMVVANWINMQYYASTVDPIHFGSGNKTVHNVVGHFGIFSGNGGDLMTGLPWQSIHDGRQYQHHPLRLLVVLAAPRSAIEAVLNKHEAVGELVSNGWIHLLAVENRQFYRYTEQQTWEEIAAGTAEHVEC